MPNLAIISEEQHSWTKMLLPNGKMKNPVSKEFCDRVWLNPPELDIFQTAIPEQHYHVSQLAWPPTPRLPC